jgi:hypothetical protein
MPSKGSWGKTQEAMENQGGGTFLRLENDGDKAVVAICGSPFHRDQAFNEATNKSEPWDERAKAAGRRKTSRYAMNVFAVSVKGKATGEMRVFDMNFASMTTIIGLKEKYGFAKYLFEITRHGAKGDTKTSYQLLPDAEITAEQRALFGSPDPKDVDGWIEGTVPLIDLEAATTDEAASGDTAVADDVKKGGDKKSGGGAAKPVANGTTGHAAPAQPAAAPAQPATAPATPAAPTAAPAAAGAATISKEAAQVIIAKLKPLDVEKGLNPFKARFPYIVKISDVLASDEAAAITYANQLATPTPPAAQDPFG